MGENTETGRTLQELADKSQISGKSKGFYCCKLRKRKVKNLKLFRNYSSRLARVLSTIRAGRARAVEEMFARKLIKN